MTIATITKTFTFDSAHQLPDHLGKCARLHGHTYTVAVEVSGTVQEAAGDSSTGMVLDFADLSATFTTRIKDVCDHRFLIPTRNPQVRLEERRGDRVRIWLGRSQYLLPRDNIATLPILTTTAECLARYMLRLLHDAHPEVVAVTVWETPTACASVTWGNLPS